MGLIKFLLGKAGPRMYRTHQVMEKKKKFLYSSFIKSWTPNTVKMAASTVPLLTRHTVPAP